MIQRIGANMRILPDGTVEIKNKRTGQTKVVNPNDLPNYGITYQSYATELEAAKKVGVPTTAEITPTSSTADKKNKDSYNSVQNLLDTLENSYQKAGGGSFGIGPGSRLKGAGASAMGSMGLNEDAAIYNDAKEGFAATLKSLTGDTGVLTDQDFERLSKILPGLGSTKKEAIEKFQQLRDQVSAKFGGQKVDSRFQPKTENTYNPVSNLLDAIPGMSSLAGYTDKAVKGDLAQEKRPITPLEGVGYLGGPLGMLLTRPDVVKETLPAATEAVIAGQTVGGAVNGIKGAVGGLINGKSNLGLAREAAAKAVEKPVSTDSLMKAGEEYIKRDPTAARLWNDVLKPALEKQPKMSIPDLLKQIGVWNDAYTSAGKVGKTALAGLNDALARSGKELIKSEAPEVAELTAKLAKVYNAEKNVTKFLPAAIGGAGATLGGYLMGKSLGQKR